MTNYRHHIFVGLVLSTLVVATALFFSFLGHRDNGHPAYPVTRITCVEDDPCWNPATRGNHRGYVCEQEPDGSIQAYYDTRGMDPRGRPVDCP